MNTRLAISIFLLLIVFNSFAQKQADLKKFVKNDNIAIVTTSKVDSLINSLTKKFISIANDTNTKANKIICKYFSDYKINPDNVEYNVYPDLLDEDHLTIQYIDYLEKYGWIGENYDSVYNSSTLTALVFIPVFDCIHKGQALNTICFRVIFQARTESINKTGVIFKREENIVELKRIDLF